MRLRSRSSLWGDGCDAPCCMLRTSPHCALRRYCTDCYSVAALQHPSGYRILRMTCITLVTGTCIAQSSMPFFNGFLLFVGLACTMASVIGLMELWQLRLSYTPSSFPYFSKVKCWRYTALSAHLLGMISYTPHNIDSLNCVLCVCTCVVCCVLVLCVVYLR